MAAAAVRPWLPVLGLVVVVGVAVQAPGGAQGEAAGAAAVNALFASLIAEDQAPPAPGPAPVTPDSAARLVVDVEDKTWTTPVLSTVLPPRALAPFLAPERGDGHDKGRLQTALQAALDAVFAGSGMPCSASEEACDASARPAAPRMIVSGVEVLRHGLGEALGPRADPEAAWTGLLAVSLSEGSINTNALTLVDPRGAASVLPLPSWFAVDIPHRAQLTAGRLVLFPGHVRHYLPPHGDEDEPRVCVRFVVEDASTHPPNAGLASVPPAAPPIPQAPGVAVEALWATTIATMALADTAGVDSAALAHAVEQLRRSSSGVAKSNKGGWQSTTDLFRADVRQRHPALKDLRAACYAALHRYLYPDARPDQPAQALVVHRTKVEIHAAWAGINRRGHFNSLHSHPGSHLSGVYYVRADRGTRIHFLRPQRGCQPEARHSVASATGRLILFPSWLHHWVDPNLGDGARIMVAFNARVIELDALGRSMETPTHAATP